MTNPPDRNLPSAVGAGQILSIVDRGLLLMAAMFAMLGWCVMASRIMSDTHPICFRQETRPKALRHFRQNRRCLLRPLREHLSQIQPLLVV